MKSRIVVRVIAVGLLAFIFACGTDECSSSNDETLILIDPFEVVPRPGNTVDLKGAITFSVEDAVTWSEGDADSLIYEWFLNFPSLCVHGTCKHTFVSGPGIKKVEIDPCHPLVSYAFEDTGPYLLELFVGVHRVWFDPLTGHRTEEGTNAYVHWWLEIPVPCP